MTFPVENSNNHTAQLSITNDAVIITYSNDELNETFPLDSIYRAHASGNNILELHICRAVGELHDGSRETLTDVRAAVNWRCETKLYTTAEAHQVVEALQQHTSFHQVQPTTKVYVLINPAAGARQAAEQWRETVRPMLEKAGLHDFDVQETHPDGGTREQAAQVGLAILQDAPRPAVIICLGGDGVLHDLVNGLSDVATRGARFRIGVIPSGSGNAFAHSLNLQSVEHATLRIIKDQAEPFRLMDVTLGTSTTVGELSNVVYDPETRKRILVVMSWGFHCQIVSRARHLDHKLGNVRFAMAAKELMSELTDYTGTLVALDARRYIGGGENNNNDDVFGPKQTEKWNPGRFTYFLATKQHSLEKGFKIAPLASHTSKEMDVVIMREATAEQLTTASIKAFQGGRHVQEKDVEYYKTPELILQVHEADEVCLDGEIIVVPANGVVRVKVLTDEPYLEAFSATC
ncbi:hypothetical protein DFQ28_000136 [Apophysomyces sp. BC1034]|nr:hypothetical protein DFQ30_000307 [Apophysomyces sp. BC1015]KAG0168368.1 hypothetical protein DFQ29_010180 [Apophysomyces sp. BC1021]KAG0184103.1 hypothetical protein DFQ28_000136 [Apophysomyces sp. BC1034]